MSDSDDIRPIIRRLTRRETLMLMGGAALAFVVGCGDDDDAGSSGGTTTATASGTAATTAAATSTATTSTLTQSATAPATVAPLSCVITPELTEGPYFVDTRMDRSDIREDRQGVPLEITMLIAEMGTDSCTPIQGAVVDMWHCDAEGTYSGVSGNSGTFLRGIQTTDANGQVKFTTVFPGWYQGRAIHIHFKVRTDPAAASGHEFTSQLFFDDATIDTILTAAPYNTRGAPSDRNANDGIYTPEMLITLNGDNTSGWKGTYGVGVDFS